MSVCCILSSPFHEGSLFASSSRMTFHFQLGLANQSVFIEGLPSHDAFMAIFSSVSVFGQLDDADCPPGSIAIGAKVAVMLVLQVAPMIAGPVILKLSIGEEQLKALQKSGHSNSLEFYGLRTVILVLSAASVALPFTFLRKREAFRQLQRSLREWREGLLRLGGKACHAHERQMRKRFLLVCAIHFLVFVIMVAHAFLVNLDLVHLCEGSYDYRHLVLNMIFGMVKQLAPLPAVIVQPFDSGMRGFRPLGPNQQHGAYLLHRQLLGLLQGVDGLLEGSPGRGGRG